MNSLRSLTEFDADPNVLVCIAHDPAPMEIMKFFPTSTINDWKQEGWKQAMHWHFLNELPVEGKVGRGTLVDGLYRDGKKVKTLTGEKV